MLFFSNNQYRSRRKRRATLETEGNYIISNTYTGVDFASGKAQEKYCIRTQTLRYLQVKLPPPRSQTPLKKRLIFIFLFWRLSLVIQNFLSSSSQAIISRGDLELYQNFLFPSAQQKYLDPTGTCIVHKFRKFRFWKHYNKRRKCIVNCLKTKISDRNEHFSFWNGNFDSNFESANLCQKNPVLTQTGACWF